ncbi:MAG TPA: hypothetical protein VK959_01275 [Methylophilaceae bacterium]|nr:hypothetical protein [Methylophilaceae bacterium]
MGESKRRGSKDERVTEAVAQRKRKLDELKRELGIPEGAEFCGYLIHHTENDEFIQAIEDTPLIVKRAFVKAPEEAMRFGRYMDANQFVRPEKGENVVGLFAVDGRFVVFPVI